MSSDEKKFNQELSKDAACVTRIEARKRPTTKEADPLGRGRAIRRP